MKKQISELHLKRLLGNSTGSPIVEGFKDCRCSEIPELEQENEKLKTLILSTVDNCFHAFASSYRSEAKEMAEEIIKQALKGCE